MPFSYTTISADGSTNTFAVPFPYISTSHVSVKVNGVATTFTFPTSATVTLTDTAASLTGKTVEIRRTTPKTTRLVDFQDAATLTEASLDLSADQQFYVMQEVSDDNSAKLTLGADDTFDALGKKIKNLAAGTADQDAVNFAQLTAAALSPVTPNATNIAYTPTGTIASTNVQTAINELDAEKASLANPNTFSANQTLSGTGPRLILVESDATTDNQRWDIIANTESLVLRTVNNADTVSVPFITVERTGTTVDSVTIGAPTILSGTNPQLLVSGTTPQFVLRETDAAVNNQWWDIIAGGERFAIRAGNDTNTSATEFVSVERTGPAIDNVSIGGIEVTLTGGRLTFPSTPIPSPNATTLDDYREGTWTPTIGGSATYNGGGQLGRYTKIGRLVTIDVVLSVSSIGTGSPRVISGLPFTSEAAQSTSGQCGYWANCITACVGISANIGPSATTITLGALAAAATASGVSDVFGTNTEIRLQMQYLTAS